MIEEGERLNTLSMVALGLAGGTTASAIVFFVLDSSVNKTEGLSSVSPTLTQDSIGVTTSWAF